MFDRFTDRARKVMDISLQEALRFNHDYIGPEHMLLGIVLEGSGVAVDVLKSLDIDPKGLARELTNLMKLGATIVTMGQLPFTPESKRVLELSLEESSSLGHNYIGSEHLLLALLHLEQGIAARVLKRVRLNLQDVRDEVLSLLGPSSEIATSRLNTPAPRPYARQEEIDALRHALHDLNARVRALEERQR